MWMWSYVGLVKAVQALAVGLIVMMVTWWIDLCFRYKSLRKIPGPKGIPILGNALQMGTNPVDFLAALVKFTKEHGNVIKLWISSRPFIFFSEANAVEYFLSSTNHISKSVDYDFLLPWLGRGLITANGEHWRVHRKIITPAFHFKLLENSIEVFHSASDELFLKLENSVKEEKVDIYPLITNYTLDVILETAMGTTLKSHENKTIADSYIQAIKDECQVLLTRAFSPWKQFGLLFPLSGEYHVQQRAVKILHGFSNKVIAARKNNLLDKTENKSEEGNEDKESGIKKRVAFLDLLLEAKINGESLSDSDIREEVDTFMFANRLVKEVIEIMGKERRPFTMKDFSEMKYLEMVIKEGLRKYPPVPFYARELKEDVHYGDMFLPKGVTIEIFTWSLHRNPELYPEPEKFDPERFTAENIATRHPYAYVPFSLGPRNCIGQKFAMLEMKAIIANIVHQFELYSTGHQPVFSGEAILKSDNGIFIGIKKRNRQEEISVL